MISDATLEKQRREIEFFRQEAERLEAEARVKAAREEAVRLGVMKWCAEGCGRVVTLRSETGECPACKTRKCMRRLRAGRRGDNQ